MTFISFLLCACVLLLMPHNVTTKLQFAFSSLFRIPLGTGRVIALAAQSPSPSQDISSEGYDKRQYLELQNHADNLQAELDQERSEKQRLAQVRLLRAWASHGLVSARVTQELVGANQIIINRGTRDRLGPEQFILAQNAIVGSICDLDKHQAKVTLISDKSSNIPVFIKSEQANHNGLLRGLGNGTAKIQDVPYDRKIAIGDPVHVRAIPGRLEVPVVVGRVLQCDQDEIEPLLWDIRVEPASDLKRLSQVYVIVIRAQDER